MRTIQNTLPPIFIWALFFTPNFASAQDEAVKMGLSLTPNLSWMTSTDYDHLSSGKNLNFGFEFAKSSFRNPKLDFANAKSSVGNLELDLHFQNVF